MISIERMFAELAAKYPSLDPAVFITDLGDILEGLILNTFDLTCEQNKFCGVTDCTVIEFASCWVVLPLLASLQP